MLTEIVSPSIYAYVLHIVAEDQLRGAGTGAGFGVAKLGVSVVRSGSEST